MDENIWNNQRFRFLQKTDDKETLFNNTKKSYRYFNICEKEIVENFIDRYECDLVLISNLVCELNRYYVEERDEEDDFIVHRLTSKIILN